MPRRSSRREEQVRETRAIYRPRRGAKLKDGPADWRWVEINREHLQEQYAGRWIAVAEERVVGAGVNLTTALRQAEKNGVREPFVTAFKKARHAEAAQVPHWL